MPQKKEKLDEGLAVVALVLNVILLPGLGTVIGRKIKEGIWQMVLWLGSWILGITLIVTLAITKPLGIIVIIPLMIIGTIVAWIWALISGIRILQENN
jgi:hypothetical protein